MLHGNNAIQVGSDNKAVLSHWIVMDAASVPHTFGPRFPLFSAISPANQDPAYCLLRCPADVAAIRGSHSRVRQGQMGWKPWRRAGELSD
jgi:hypothetical protein